MSATSDHRRVVVVTGASRGIGKASAAAVAAEGADLVLVARSTDDAPNRGGLPGTLETVAHELRSVGADVLTVAADLADPASIERIVEATHDRFGRCDVLVNNAAVSFIGPFLDVPTKRWRTAIEVNLVAPVALAQAFLPGMLERAEGRILNITSGAADTTQHHEVPQLPYSASKAGLDAWSYGLAHQLEGTGVAVNLLAPEVLTEAVTFSVDDPELLDELSHRMVPAEPYGRAVAWVARRPTSFTGRYLTNRDLVELGALRLADDNPPTKGTSL